MYDLCIKMISKQDMVATVWLLPCAIYLQLAMAGK